MRRAIAVLISLTLLAPGCVTVRASSSRRGHQANTSGPDRTLLTAYVKQLPVGSRVRASLVGGGTVRGTLMHAADEGIVVQRRTRIPVPPTDIPIATLSAVELETASGLGKVVGIGAAAGAGAALAVFLIIAALYAGD